MAPEKTVPGFPNDAFRKQYALIVRSQTAKEGKLAMALIKFQKRNMAVAFSNDRLRTQGHSHKSK